MCAGNRAAVPHWAALIPGQFHRCFLPCLHAKEVINVGAPGVTRHVDCTIAAGGEGAYLFIRTRPQQPGQRFGG